MLSELIHRLADYAQTIALNKLLKKRHEKGFQAFIFDLKESSHNYQSEGWQLANGLLTVESDANAQEINDFLASKLSDRLWFESNQPTSIDASPVTYGYDFKVLGKWGANPAVDPVLFLENSNNELTVLTIIRADKTAALPGGMMESTVQKTCIHELLEECFSGNFFKPDSKTSHIIDAFGYWDNVLPKPPLLTLIQRVLDETKQLSQQQKNELYGMLQNTTVPQKPSEVIQSLCNKIDELTGLSACQRAQVLASVRVGLYEKTCPVEYEAMKTLLLQRMENSEQVANLSDPRNTNSAWMVTTVVSMLFPHSDMNILEDYGLEYEGGAGDDAHDSHFRSVKDFCCENPYADHAALVLHALARTIEKNENLKIAKALLNQCLSIANCFQQELPDDAGLQIIVTGLESLIGQETQNQNRFFSRGNQENNNQELKRKNSSVETIKQNTMGAN